MLPAAVQKRFYAQHCKLFLYPILLDHHARSAEKEVEGVAHVCTLEQT